MYSYIKGIVTFIKSNYIVVENNGIGYMIYTANPYSFNEEQEFTVYLYQHIKEEENTLYGFKTLEEKELFLKLIDVKGLGPKMALTMLASASIEGVIDAINRENILYLKKIPKIGEKLARQIVLDLKGKVYTDKEVIEEDTSNELFEALKALGYKDKDIKNVVAKVNKEDSLEEQIKESLKLLLR